jgi:hypothetical protein
MEDTSGFYRWSEQGYWIYAGKGPVYGPWYILSLDTKDDYEYPIEGWNWCEEKPADSEITITNP